ncbi:MAG: abortive infection family protein [Solirubrobacterales bacterium]
MPAADVLEAASELLHLMIARVTDGGEVDKYEFASARKKVLADETGGKVAPQCVRICREPDAVWSYIKGQDPELPTYESRRIFLRKEFAPLLDALESFDEAPIDELVTGQAEELNAASIERTWAKALDRRESDPEGAITLSRTMLESVCKTILDDREVDYKERDDLPKLYKNVSASLGIAPSDHTEEQFKAILGACTTVVHELGSLRNRVSDSHGPGRVVYNPAPRHAALAVNLAGSMALFLMQTHEVRD